VSLDGRAANPVCLIHITHGLIMATDKKEPQTADFKGLGNFPLELVVSLATAPLLVGLVGARVLSELVQEAGLVSEEVFRGDRLPLLKFPEPASSYTDTGDPE
jgi:hypothetical protein